MLAVDGEQSIARNIAGHSSAAVIVSHFSKTLGQEKFKPALRYVETHMKILGAMEAFVGFQK